MNDIAIRVDSLGKRYRIGAKQERYYTLRDSVSRLATMPLRWLKRDNPIDTTHQVWALKDVSFEVMRGEVLGVIGRNGAGKSTLLKILSRVTEPTEGYAEVHGRVGSLLEVGTGFHPELTGRENIYLSGAILGMRKREIDRKFDEIVDFAEVERFLDTPAKRYSSGMYMRLAFAVAAHLEPEILMVDEVLAVGDAAFQKKCLGKMGQVAGDGRTVLFVSHNLAAVQNLCQRGVVLRRGMVSFAGTQTEAIAQYMSSNKERSTSLRNRSDRWGSGAIRIVNIEFRDLQGHQLDCVASGQDVDVYIHFVSQPGFHDSNVAANLRIKTLWEVPVFLHHNRLTRTTFGTLPPRGAFVCRIRKLPLPASTYRVDCTVLAGSDYLDRVPDAVDLTVVEGSFFGSGEVPPIDHGVCLVEGEWRLENCAAATEEGFDSE